MNQAIKQQTYGHVRLFKNHGSSIGYWEGWVELDGTVVLQHAKKLDGKVTRSEYQAEGKNIGRSNETTPLMQGQLELDSRARKQLDKGYVNKLSEAEAPSTNTLGLKKPMLATPLEKVKPGKIDWSNAYVQPKLDGHRALYCNGTLYSRQGKILDLPHIVEAIRSEGLDHLHLDGELYLHGHSLQELSKLIKKNRPETLDLQYHVYDWVTDKPFTERIAGLARNFANRKHPNLLPVEAMRVNGMNEVLAAHSQFRLAGYEGTMLRFGDDHYLDGKRSRTLLKVKEFQDAEFKIIGVREGKPYIHRDTTLGIDVTYRVPVWICDAGNGETFTVTAQGDMHEKNAQWYGRELHIGKALTVKFHYLSADGIPQLPIALRFYETI